MDMNNTKVRVSVFLVPTIPMETTTLAVSPLQRVGLCACESKGRKGVVCEMVRMPISYIEVPGSSPIDIWYTSHCCLAGPNNVTCALNRAAASL